MFTKIIKSKLLLQLAILAGPGNSVEMEKNLDDGKVKAITAYYGDLIAKCSENESV